MRQSLEHSVRENLKPAVRAVIFDPKQRVLLIRRAEQSDKGLWCFPGGKVESGENLAEAVYA